jgi:hypothetical protein
MNVGVGSRCAADWRIAIRVDAIGLEVVFRANQKPRPHDGRPGLRWMRGQPKGIGLPRSDIKTQHWAIAKLPSARPSMAIA